MLQLKLSCTCCRHLLSNTKHTLIVPWAFAVSCAEKGILSLWSQMFAEFLAVTWMLDHEAGVKKSLPVFGGDFKHHMIMHQASNHVLHFMKHDPDDAGKQSAVACMWHLLRQDNVLPLETGKILYFYMLYKLVLALCGVSQLLHCTQIGVVAVPAGCVNM